MAMGIWGTTLMTQERLKNPVRQEGAARGDNTIRAGTAEAQWSLGIRYHEDTPFPQAFAVVLLGASKLLSMSTTLYTFI